MKRNKYEVLEAILAAVEREPVILTQVLLKANIDYKTFNRFRKELNSLIEEERVEGWGKTGYKRIFRLTEDGKRALKLFRQLRRLLKDKNKTEDRTIRELNNG